MTPTRCFVAARGSASGWESNLRRMTQDDLARRVARRAARRLASPRWPELAVDLEAVLDNRRTTPRADSGQPDQFVDPIALASLIVAAADLAWSVYADLRKKKTAKPGPVIVQRLRIELGESRLIEPAERDRVIEVVVDEIIRTDDHPGD